METFTLRSLPRFQPKGRLLLKVIALGEQYQDHQEISEPEFQFKAVPSFKERVCKPVPVLFVPIIPWKVMLGLGSRNTQVLEEDRDPG